MTYLPGIQSMAGPQCVGVKGDRRGTQATCCRSDVPQSHAGATSSSAEGQRGAVFNNVVARILFLPHLEMTHAPYINPHDSEEKQSWPQAPGLSLGPDPTSSQSLHCILAAEGEQASSGRG